MTAERNHAQLDLLRRTGALQTDGPYRLASGRESPYYVDVRRAVLTPEGSLRLGIWLANRAEIACEHGVDAIGGPELGAALLTPAVLSHWAWARPDVRGFVVRKQAKGHGTGGRLVGPLDAPCRCLLLEDVVTTGGSSLDAAGVLREAGHTVVGVLCVLDRQEGGREVLGAAGLGLWSLLTAGEVV